MRLNKINTSILIFLLLISGIFSTSAQERNIPVNTDWDHERHSWNAWWISHPDAPVFDYGVMLFRKQFNLNILPDSCIIYISGDNRYRLWVNGKPVVSGPARGDFMNWNYERLNIAPYLLDGQNIIGAEVYNFGKYRPVAQFSRQTAFILEGDGPLGEILRTGRSWKVCPNNSYTPIQVTKNIVRGFYVAGPTDRFDASNFPWGWQFLSYDDSSWAAAEAVSIGAGRGYMHGIPWHLVPRSIPMMEEKTIRFQTIRRYVGSKPDIQFLEGKKDWEIPAQSHSIVLLDQNELTIAYPELFFSAGKGAVIKISYAESLYDSLFHKGNRNEINGKNFIGYYDLILPDGGANRKFRPLWLRTWRYLQLEITTSDEPVVLSDFYGIFTAYPFIPKAGFGSEDPFLRSVWETGWRTARLCAGETYMDCPYYEQLQYIGDTRIQSLISLYVTGDDRLMRNAIKQIDNSRIPEGLTLGRAPSFIPQVTPPFSLYWVDMVYDYWMHRKDDTFVCSMLPGIEGVLAWFERRIDSTGMVGPSDWFNFSDWTPGFQVGAPLSVDTGNSALISLDYVYSLQRASALFFAEGFYEKADHYASVAASVNASVRKQCYNSERKLLSDAPGSMVFSQHTNIFAVLTGLFSTGEKEVVLKKILLEKDMIQTTVYFKFYLFEALRGTSIANDYLEMLGPWKDMLDLGLTTFREDDYEDRSDCHAWSASPLYHLLSLVAGVRPGSPGFETVIIEPSPGKLPEIKCEVAHPKGIIQLNLEFYKKGKVKGKIALPEGVKGEFRMYSKVINLHGGQQEINF